MTQDKGAEGRGRLAGLDGVMLLATMLTLFGYLLPWFRQSSRSRWSYSGWEYASLSTGGGWTLWTFAFLLVAVVVSFWARTAVEAAMTALAAGIGALVMILAVVAASFGNIGRRDDLNSIAELPFGLGLPLLAVGLGLLIATACRDIARA
ncbi:hypothetical protein D0Q02_27515 [Micromonospora craniellae]|uniref:Uncharacterized protein n=1 Tax=Micromonospora craniellae TaxID=2294034 RepID=A0A372FRZ7_9ACTN|nr:hypothetical protein D0Q02_27515 [Micromonospora craniellae]